MLRSAAQSSAPAPSLTLSETSVRLRGVLSELNSIDKQLTNSGISYASEESGGAVTDADLPVIGGDGVKPSHRQVAALRSYCQDLLIKCDEEKGGKAKPALGTTVEEEKEEQKVVIRDLNDSPRSGSAALSPSPVGSSTQTADEDKAVVGQAVAAALANEPARNTAAGAKAAAQAEERAKNAKVSGSTGGNSANPLDVFTVSRWGELLREPRKPLTKEQQKKRAQMMERDEEREIKWLKMMKQSVATTHPACVISLPPPLSLTH